MQFIALLLVALQLVDNVFSFRDYPPNYNVNAATGGGRESCKNCTVYENSLKNVLSRKKRAFVFYKGTLVVITNVSAKRIISVIPAGLVSSAEIDMFWDVPVAVDGWRKPFEDIVQRMRAEKKQDEEANAEEDKLKNVGVVNVSAIPSEEYYKVPFASPVWSQFPLKHPSNGQSVWADNEENNRHVLKYPKSRRKNYMKASSRRRNYSPYRSTFQYFPRQGPSQEPPKPRENKKPSWHHHREYRERRELYEKLDEFGKRIGMGLKKCILRAICEMREQLLPEGESFINDAARILFTLPTDHDDTEDEYTQMALEKDVDCARRFMVTCPHSPMEYFFKNFRPTAQHPTRQPTAQEIMDSIKYA